jgi:hypothetical protein
MGIKQLKGYKMKISDINNKQIDEVIDLFDSTMELWSKKDVTALTALSCVPMLIDYVFNLRTDFTQEDRENTMKQLSLAVNLYGQKSIHN